MKAQPNLDQLSDEQVRALAARLLVEVEQKAVQLEQHKTVIDQKDRANRHLEAVNENWPMKTPF
jgi:hypothetical protein